MAELTQYQKDILIRTALSEAGGEGEDGMADVLHVILNRAASGKFPSDPAKVALQNKQFSSWNAGSGGNNPGKWSPGSAAYQTAARVLEQVATGGKPDQTGGALYFHTPGASPGWPKGVNTNGKIVRNGHVFYPTREVGSVATQLDTARPAPTPAKPSAVMTAARNRQNMTPAADTGATKTSVAASYLTKDGQGVTSPIEIVQGKEMVTKLPQTPGQSQIERASRPTPGQPQIERSKPRTVVQPSNAALAGAAKFAAAKPAAAPVVARALPATVAKPVATKAPSAAETRAEQALARAATKPAAAPAAKPRAVTISAAETRSEQAIARAATKPTAKLDGIGDMPAFGDVTMLRNSNVPGPTAAVKVADRLRPQPPLIDPGAALGYSAVVPGIQSAAMIAARVPKKVAPAPVTRTVARTVARAPVVRAPVIARPVVPVVVPPVVPTINLANHNAAQLAAVAAGKSSYVGSNGAVQPTKSISGKLRNTYGD